MFDKIQTYVVVTLIAALIWLYAEGQTVKDYPNESISIQFVPAQGDDTIVTLPSESTVTNQRRVSVSINTSTVGKELLDEQRSKGPIQLPVVFNPDRLEQSIPIRLLLEESAVFADAGVNLIRVDPENVTVRVERIESVSLPVVVVSGETELTGQPTFEPKTATVNVRSTIARRLKDVKLEARLDRIDLTSIDPNQRQTLDVPLSWPADSNIEDVDIEPLTAKVTFQLKPLPVETTLTRVRIILQTPPTVALRYDISLHEDNPFIDRVELRGTPNEIARINEAKTSGTESNLVWANLQLLNAADLREGEFQARPELNAPPGVTVKTPLPLIKYKVVAREAPTTTVAPPAVRAAATRNR